MRALVTGASPVGAGLRPSSASSPDLLRLRLEEDGYAYLPRYLAAAVLEPLRNELLEIARTAGWLEPGATLEHGIANRSAACGPPELAFMDVHRRMFERELLHRFPHDPIFTALFERLFDEPPLLHPQIRIRLRFPHFEGTTPAHQDHFVTGGTPETFTVWVPLTDCPVEMGGLQVLPGSHRLGLLPARQDPAAGTLEMACELPDGWITANYRFGDVLIFHSLTVHRALPNVSDRLRISIDFRFQRASDSIEAARFAPPHGLDSWDDLYRGWRAGDLRYYWRSSNLNCSPPIATLRQIASMPDHPQSSAARELLRQL